LEDADDFVRELRGGQLIPSSIEILNGLAVQKMRYSVSMPPNGNYLVAVGLEGVAESIDRQVTEMSEMGKKHGTLEAVTLDAEKHQAFWVSLRDFSSRLTDEDSNVISMKSNFLISKCGDILGSYEKIARGLGIHCAFISHAGNGILYSHALPGKSFRSKADSFVELIEKLTAEAAKNGGGLVVESSPPSIKKKVDVWGQSRSDYLVARRLKEQIDPAGILNIGRFVGGI
jgi:glycolate oxidase FAD binding subunit